MIPYFASLGERIETTWRRCGYDEESFPDIALEALERDPPSEGVGVGEVIDWIFGSSQSFQQPDLPRLFGEPPVMVFQGPRFYIEALFWLSGTTEIHEHGFSGAFAVLAGSSVHSHWRFHAERRINSRMICGRLERVSTEILRRGGVRAIRSGNRLIHQLFHLDLPSVTVVVRTYGEEDRRPQFKYLPPGLALDNDTRDALRVRRLLFLDGMARGHLDGLRDHVERLIVEGDLETLYYAFSVLVRRKVDGELLEELLALARQRHGEVIDLFLQACETEDRIRKVIALRAKISHPEARFLLALLMLLPDREAIFEIIRQQFPEAEPLPAIESWLEGVAEKETVGFDWNDENRLIFRSLVEGQDAEGVLGRLRDEFSSESIEKHRDRLLDHVGAMARSDLFRPLFSRSPFSRQPMRT